MNKRAIWNNVKAAVARRNLNFLRMAWWHFRNGLSR